MSIDSSGKYYQDNKGRIQNKKVFQVFTSLSKEEKKKSNNMVANDTRIYQKMKNKSWLSIGKSIIH